MLLFLNHTNWTVDVPGGTVVKNLPASAGGTGLIPGSGRSPGEGNGKPLQCSCLENPMDRGPWRATVQGGHKESDMTEHKAKPIGLFSSSWVHMKKEMIKRTPKLQRNFTWFSGIYFLVWFPPPILWLLIQLLNNDIFCHKIKYLFFVRNQDFQCKKKRDLHIKSKRLNKNPVA